MSDFKNLLSLAQQGAIDQLLELAAQNGEVDSAVERAYQWATIAGYYGSEEGEEMAGDIYEAELNRGGDENVSMLHLQIAEWFCFEEEGLPKDEGLIIDQLKYAEDFGLTQNFQDIDQPLKEIRSHLSPEGQTSFDDIFPEL